MPALVTPFRDGAVDFDALAALVEWHIAEGSHGWCPSAPPAKARRSAMRNTNRSSRRW
jgi:hypothetical protein